jgi:hypothetical protein
VDPAINFIYDFNTSPVIPLGVDHYSIKWTGKIQPQFSETYTFYTKSDDGIRVTVNGVQLINNFVDHGTTEDAASIALVAGQKYDISIDYYNRNGGGMATLKWSGPSTLKQMVPATQLYPDTSSIPAVPVCATNTAPVNNSTIGTQTTASLIWNAVPSATAYDVYLWTGAAAPATPTAANVAATSYNAFALSAATGYSWYIVPKNAAGAATGCSTGNKTSFTTATAADGTGTGLQGTYFNNITLTGSPVVTRTDTTINFDYIYTAAAPGVNLENYSVRWTGQVKAAYSQTYTFYAVTDDGVRLWVNGVQLINNWVNQGATEKSGSIALVAGQRYDIVMEYYQGTGYASSKLYWSGAGTPKVIVPKLQLFPPGYVAPTVPLCTTNISPSNGTTVALATSASLSWNAAASATTYDLYVWTGATAPVAPTVANIATTSYNATGLTAAGTYNWYVVPKNATGSAIGCSTTKSTFVTAAASAPSCTDNAAPANGSTVGASNAATLVWTAAATAISYDVYIWTGTTVPSVPTANTISTSYNATGLSTATLYNWYVAPRNASGPATGCAISNMWTFTTAGATVGTGLQGAYFNNITLTGSPVVTRVDPTVNFDYIYTAAAPGVNLENYSVRWTGQVKPLLTESYTFYVNTDDGVRLWVNGVQLVNNWVNQGVTEKSGSIALLGGQRYDIVIEYFQGTGYATSKLSWSSTGTAKAIIPVSQLYPPGAAARVGAQVNTAAPAFSAVISPNPVAVGRFTSLQVASNKTCTANVNIINSNGFVISQQRLQLLKGLNTARINTTTLKQGLYIISITGGTSPTNSKLLIR